MVEGIIFDVDGTILNSMTIWMEAGILYLKTLGIHEEDNLGEILFSLTMKEGAEYIKNTYQLNLSVRDIIDGVNNTVYKFYAENVQPKEGIVQFLQCVYDKKIPMTIATSTDRTLIEIALKRLGIEKFFQKIFTTSEIGKGKDEPDIYIEAQKCMKSSRKNTWLIDDAAYALKTAAEHGFRTVGIFDFSSDKDQEEVRSVSDLYIREWGEYETLIKEMNM